MAAGDLPDRMEFLQPRHAAGNVALIVWSHVALVAWFWLGFLWLPLWLYLPVSLCASVVHQKAMSEWIHEGGHFNLLRDRKWNDRLTDALAGIFFGVSADAYRSTHFPHHARRSFFVESDPDTNFLTIHSKAELHAAILRDLCGLTMLQGFLRFGSAEGKSRARVSFVAATAAVHLSLIAALWSLGRLDAYALYYGSLICLYPLHNRLRVYGQHLTFESDGTTLAVDSPASRTIDAGALDRFLWTSPRLLWHWEHHRYPQLPWRALPGLCRFDPSESNRYQQRRYEVLAKLYAGLP